MKIFRFIIIIVILIVIAAFVVIWIEREKIASKVLSNMLKTEVTIGEIDLSLTLSTLTVKDIVVYNPPNSPSKTQHALVVKSFLLKLQPTTLFKKVIHINEIFLDRVHFNVELYNTTGSDNNWSRIINNATQGTSTPSQKAPAEPSKDETKFILDLFKIKDLTLNVYSQGAVGVNLKAKPVSDFEIKDIGTSKPVTSGQLVNIIGSSLLSYVAKEYALNSLLNDTMKLPGSFYKGMKTTIENPGDFFEGVGEDVEESSKKTGKFFKKLFSLSKKHRRQKIPV